MTRDSLYPKVQSALAQVTARKGQPSKFCLGYSIEAAKRAQACRLTYILSHHL